MNTLYPNLRIKYCIPEIKCPNILYTQKPWPTLTRKTPGKTQHSAAVTPGKHAAHFTEHLANAIQQCVLQLILPSLSATCKQAVDRCVLFGFEQFLPRIPSALFWLSYQQQLCQETGVSEYYNGNWLLSNLSSANSEYDKTSVLEVCRNRRCFLPNSRHAKCMQRPLLLPPRGREAKDFRWFRFPSNRAR